MLLNREY